MLAIESICAESYRTVFSLRNRNAFNSQLLHGLFTLLASHA